MEETLTVRPLSDVHRPLAVRFWLWARARRLGNTSQLVYYETEQGSRFVTRRYHAPELNLNRLSVTGVEASSPIRPPGPSRTLRSVPLPAGDYELSFTGPNDEPIAVAVSVPEDRVGIYEVAAAIGSYTPPARPQALRHVVYHGWRPGL